MRVKGLTTYVYMHAIKIKYSIFIDSLADEFFSSASKNNKFMVDQAIMQA